MVFSLVSLGQTPTSEDIDDAAAYMGPAFYVLGTLSEENREFVTTLEAVLGTA